MASHIFLQIIGKCRGPFQLTYQSGQNDLVVCRLSSKVTLKNVTEYPEHSSRRIRKFSPKAKCEDGFFFFF